MYSFSAISFSTTALTVDYLVCHDDLHVELRTHAQIHEIALLLIQVLQCLLSLAHEIRDQRRVLHSVELLFRKGANWNS